MFLFRKHWQKNSFFEIKAISFVFETYFLFFFKKMPETKFF